MISWHEADSLRLLPSGPDLVQTAHSTRSPAGPILAVFRIKTKIKKPPGSPVVKKSNPLLRDGIQVVEISLREEFG